MLKPEDNERLVRVTRGTPGGEMFRRYWLPALLSEELPEPDGAPVRVRLLCEDLIAFRDTNGVVGLLDAYCPHRRAPMFFCTGWSAQRGSCSEEFALWGACAVGCLRSGVAAPRHCRAPTPPRSAHAGDPVLVHGGGA